MKLVKDINILEDSGVHQKLKSIALISLLVSLCFLPFVLIAVIYFYTSKGIQFRFDFPVLILPFAFFALSIPIHELIHGLFFKIFAPKAHVSFGFNYFTFYAKTHGQTYTRVQYIIIALAPFVIISFILLCIGFRFNLLFTCYLSYILHVQGSVGDFYYVLDLIKKPYVDRVEDTDTGARYYSSQK